MSAYTKLAGLIPGRLGDAVAREILTEHAHELAEKIRENADSPQVKPHLLDGEWTGMRMAADRIDPEVS